ncbi:MAG TPA: tetratricopeptide repeat protein, partial [Chitinophagaceae bacterium]|nr:tetratricopeptide repeat protein [Chitinophagaceae bacterium]
MLKRLFAVIPVAAVFTITHAQNTATDTYIKEGIRLYDNGDYKAAKEQYIKALAIDSNSSTANYEMANTCFEMQEYQNAVNYADKVVKLKSPDSEQAYVIKGSALDMLGKPADAVDVYKLGIIIFPQSHLLYYNLALTLFNNKGDNKEIEDNLQLALQLNPLHPTCHLLMGYLMVNEGKRVKALLALYNFLLLEPNTGRAAKALNLLYAQLSKGVKKENEKSTTINLSLNKDDGDEFSAAELMLSLLEASKGIEKNKDKTENELFIDNTASFFQVLGELKKDNKDFWWT